MTVFYITPKNNSTTYMSKVTKTKYGLKMLTKGSMIVLYT